MKVKELRELISKLKNEGCLTNQNVEFVFNSKKYFASDVKAGTNTMTFNITRENYHPLTIESFENSLKLANGEINITVANGTNQNTISDSFLTDSTLELVLDQS